MLLLGFILPTWLVSTLYILIVLLVVVWMFAVVSVIKNDFVDNQKTILFLLVLIPLPVPFFGPLVYFLYAKKKFLKN